MNKTNQVSIAVIGVVVLLIFLAGISSLGGWGMMGPGMMGGWGFGPLGWVGMIFMWLVPVSFIVLTVLGVVWIIQQTTGGQINPAAPGHACPSCDHAIQADWRNCPYCGTTLVK